MSRYRTIGRRVLATLIDLLLFTPAIVVGLIYYRHSFGTPVGYAWGIAMFVLSSTFSIYFHGRYGATPGKSLVRCRVVTCTEEETIGFRVATLREAPWIVLGLIGALEDNWLKMQMPVAAIAIGYMANAWFSADLLVAVFHPKRRALHDLLAGTVVVKGEPNKAPEPTTFAVTSRAIV